MSSPTLEAAAVVDGIDSAPAALGYAFIRLLPTLHRMMVAAMHQVPDASGLNLAQFRVLARLAERDYRAAELAATLEVGRPTLTVTTEHLERRALIARQRKLGHDRRGVLLQLTPRGRALFGELKCQAAQALADLLRTAEPAERAGLASGLAALRRGLEQHGHDLPDGIDAPRSAAP